VHDVDLGILLEDFGGEVRSAGDARRGEVELPRPLLRERNEVLERLGRKLGRLTSEELVRVVEGLDEIVG